MKKRLASIVTIVLLIGVVRGVIALVHLGSNKQTSVNWGADDGLNVVDVKASYDASNDVTTVSVFFTGSNVTTNTPVSVRNWETNPWTELEKILPVVTVDMPTNILDFAVMGNEFGRAHWWVGVDKPAVIIETTGILIHQFEARSRYVLLAWSCDDPRATEFEVQYRHRGDNLWRTMGRTSDNYYMHYGFTLDVNSEWRVISTVSGGL